MFDKHTITNLLLFVVAGALLLTVAQGGLAQLSPLIATASDKGTTANANVPPAGGGGASEANGEEKDTEPNLLSFTESLLKYILLMWALALGVEAGVEFIRMLLDLRRTPLGPEPTEILKALNPWLPKPGIIPKVEEEKKEEDKASKLEGEREKPADPENPDWWLDTQEDALSGAVQGLARDGEDRNWTGIFKELAFREYDYLVEEKKRLRQNRALSLGMAIGLAFLTGLNTFQILLGPDAQKDLGYFWYRFGGILLSAFAAAAGSSVWHDLLTKLRQSTEEQEPKKEGEESTSTE